MKQTIVPYASGVEDQDPVAEAGGAPPPRLSYVIARLERVLRQRIAKCVEPYGLTVPHYTALSILGRRSGLSNAQLARRTYITPQAMNQVLDQLEQAGLIVREPHTTHGRILSTRLTNQGKAVLAACDAVVDVMEEEMLRDIKADERAKLLQTLVTCVRALHGGFEHVDFFEP
jgi:DNA-binding MarR family transcriptional regulator